MVVDIVFEFPAPYAKVGKLKSELFSLNYGLEVTDEQMNTFLFL